MRNSFFPKTTAAITVVGLLSCTAASAFEPAKWWTGLSHSSVWVSFAPPAPGAAPPNCKITDPPKEFNPPKWWFTFDPNITGSSDAVGFTVWSDTNCVRVIQDVFRSEMLADLTPFYSTLAAN